jgi:hypothetical protein
MIAEVAILGLACLVTILAACHLERNAPVIDDSDEEEAPSAG